MFNVSYLIIHNDLPRLRWLKRNTKAVVKKEVVKVKKETTEVPKMMATEKLALFGLWPGGEGGKQGEGIALLVHGFSQRILFSGIKSSVVLKNDSTLAPSQTYARASWIIILLKNSLFITLRRIVHVWRFQILSDNCWLGNSWLLILNR